MEAGFDVNADGYYKCTKLHWTVTSKATVRRVVNVLLCVKYEHTFFTFLNRDLKNNENTTIKE